MRQFDFSPGEQFASQRVQTALEASPPGAIHLPDGPAAARSSAVQPGFDERFGLRLGLRTYYINLRIGVERRSPRRRESEGQVPLSGAAFVYCLVCSTIVMLFGMACMLYLLKSGMGINLVDGPSFLHPLFDLAGD